MVKAQCVICMDDEVEFESLRFLRCGHSFCSDCTNRITSQPHGLPQSCPTCRHSIAPGDGQRLHVMFHEPELRAPNVSTVVTTLMSINADSIVQDVHRARTMRLRFMRNILQDFENALCAEEEMETRILPTYSDQEQEAKEAPELRRKIDDLTEQVDTLRSSVRELREDLSERTREISILSGTALGNPRLLRSWKLGFKRLLIYLVQWGSFWGFIFSFFFVAGVVASRLVTQDMMLQLLKLFSPSLYDMLTTNR